MGGETICSCPPWFCSQGRHVCIKLAPRTFHILQNFVGILPLDITGFVCFHAKFQRFLFNKKLATLHFYSAKYIVDMAEAIFDFSSLIHLLASPSLLLGAGEMRIKQLLSKKLVCVLPWCCRCCGSVQLLMSAGPVHFSTSTLHNGAARTPRVCHTWKNIIQF